MNLFLTDDSSQSYALLDAAESKHCIRVLRMRIGDEIWVTSGDGTMCRARICNPDDKACEVEIVERIPDYRQRQFRLHMAVAPTKNSARLEWFVEKAVEIGIDCFTPIICDHSERENLKTDRLEKLALSAMKQSLKASCPTIAPPTRLVDFFKQHDSATADDCRLICYCDGGERHHLGSRYAAGRNATVLIGPEGDFSPREVQMALDNGFLPVSLGESRLRTETAALFVVSTLNFLNA